MNEEKIRKVLEDIDNYEQSVNASLTFIHIYKWDDKKNEPIGEVLYWIGKEFKPGDVTPDIAIQLTDDRGLILELKESLPKNNSEDNDYWKEKFDNIKKYDAQLEGWHTKNSKVNQQELVLLVDQKLSRKVVDYIQSNNLLFDTFSKNFGVIQYSPATGLKNGVLLRIEHGKLDDFRDVTNKRLWEGITVALEYLFSSGLSKIKFLDYRPNPVYIMSILWDHVFNATLTEEDWRNSKMEGGKRIIEIAVTIPNIREFLVNNFSDKNSKHGIKEKWVEEALENFVRLKLAKRAKVTGEYIIKYRKKIADETPDTNKHKVFAELLYKSGVQITLENFKKKHDDKNA